jgi:hypothetical protein
MEFALLAQLVMATSGVFAALLFVPLVRMVVDAHRLAKIERLSHTYVFAAEQIYGAGHGKEKFAYVTRALSSRGVKLDEHDEYCFVRSSVEAAVREIKYIEESFK